MIAGFGDRINLFADWDGSEPADGFIIEAGREWDVLAVSAVPLGRNHRVELTLRRSVHGVVAEASERLIGRHRLIITVESPSRALESTISATPSAYVDDEEGIRLERHPTGEIEFDVSVAEPRSSIGQALRLSEASRQPVRIAPTSELDLSEASGFTVAFWFKSVDLGEVLFSTWNGSSLEDYPFEFVVQPSGEIRVYTSRGGMHYSLGSKVPIADGRWHHVAYSVSFLDGRAVMAVDGSLVDSRFLPGTGELQLSKLTLGGRYGQNTVVDGLLDEVLILPAYKTAEEIGRLARVPVETLDPEPNALRFGFESKRSRTALENVDEEAEFVTSDLTLHQPVVDVVAEFQPGRVLLTWTLERPEPQVITVERSHDGVTFEPVHRRVIDAIDLEHVRSDEVFAFEDFVSEDARIQFYRIRQEFADESVIQSSMIKVGIGAPETPSAIELIGNTPNPFSTGTEVYFRVDEPTPMQLSVWSVSGHLVKILAGGTREVGLHRIPFSASDLPSGTYFLRLETESGVQTRKMILRR